MFVSFPFLFSKSSAWHNGWLFCFQSFGCDFIAWRFRFSYAKLMISFYFLSSILQNIRVRNVVIIKARKKIWRNKRAASLFSIWMSQNVLLFIRLSFFILYYPPIIFFKLLKIICVQFISNYRNVRRSILENMIPTEPFEEWMMFNLVNAQSFLSIIHHAEN